MQLCVPSAMSEEIKDWLLFIYLLPQVFDKYWSCLLLSINFADYLD